MHRFWSLLLSRTYVVEFMDDVVHIESLFNERRAEHGAEAATRLIGESKSALASDVLCRADLLLFCLLAGRVSPVAAVR